MSNLSPQRPGYRGSGSSLPLGALPSGESLEDLERELSSSPPHRTQIPPGGPLFKDYFATSNNYDSDRPTATGSNARGIGHQEMEPPRPIAGRVERITSPEPLDSAHTQPHGKRPAADRRPHTAEAHLTPPPSAGSSSSSKHSKISLRGSSAAGGAVPSSSAPQKCLQWENIFHPKSVGMEGSFQGEWQFAGLYNNHILFSQVATTTKGGAHGKRVLIYDIHMQTTQIIKIKYDTAGLGPGAEYLLFRQGDEMHIHDVAAGRTIKSAHLRNLNKWTYNAIGFCMVDSSGNFWRWSFHDRLPPALVFRLVDRAPRERLRCLTTRDGAWNAIVGTDMDRTMGEVHCYPTDNDEARIYKGVLAAFTQTMTEDGEVIATFVAIVNVSLDELSFSMKELGSYTDDAIQIETKIPIYVVGGSPSALFIDHKLAVAVVLVVPETGRDSPSDSSSGHGHQDSQSNPVFFAFIFDTRTSRLLMKQDLSKREDDSWVIDDTGLFRERSEAAVQKLNVVRENLPMRTDAMDSNMRARATSFSHAGRGGAGSSTLPTASAHGFL
ncbi:hypothetical protein FRB95_008513 [Tulasnella sp. JGI-2019a]|nr:hypothetical protein FRB95_008513 [Tulasnella sp. JGI-2019a]